MMRSNLHSCFFLLCFATSALSSLHQPLFKKVGAEKSKLNFIHEFDVNHEKSFLFHSGFAVGGIALGDVNGDSILDMYLVSGPGENKLFLGGENISYTESKAKFNSQDQWGTGASLVDIDNDGDLDIYQCNYDAENELYLNDGNGNFSKLTGSAGLAIRDASMMANFADVDNDGDLDMYLLCNRYYRPGGRPANPPFVRQNGVPKITQEFEKYYALRQNATKAYSVNTYGRADYLFLNVGEKGKPKFVDVSEKSGMSLTGYGLSCLWIDFDSDGDQDLYVANDFNDTDRLMRNDGIDKDGVPKFTNVANKMLRSTSWSSMGSDAGDVNRDGFPDIISVDMSATTHLKSKSNMGALSAEDRKLLEEGVPKQAMRNHLLINNRVGPFKETAYAAGLAKSDWSWSVKFGDLDNDGYQDVFITNGMARNFTDADRNEAIGPKMKALIGNTSWDLFKNQSPMLEKNLAFQNEDGNHFKKREDWGLGLLGMSYSSAMGDLDNDGDLDIIVSNLGKGVKIFENKGNKNNSCRITLKGTVSNSQGIGAKVILTDTLGIKHTRWQNPWSGFQGQNDMTLHIGLGEAEPVSLVVFWPSGIRQAEELNRSETLHNVVEAGKVLPKDKPELVSRFIRAQTSLSSTEEEKFDDFKNQPLLPAKLSQEGPCIASADIDSDGDLDVFIGGSREKPATILVNEGGVLKPLKHDFFGMLSDYAEDNAAIWFDADGDGDLDLLVVTGSNEYKKNDIIYFDHLYLNESTKGEIKLVEAETFPEFADSGSCAVAADYDKDGDLDLFIGSRSIPGEYPLTPASRLLRNDSKSGEIKFVEVQLDTIKACGMVTSAVWQDMDGDGFVELVVSEDWGITRIFKNEKGTLSDVSKSANTSNRKGWWRALHAVDIDGDGDIDLVAGNAGINTKYGKLSTKKQAAIYYGDMDGSGNSRIVEAKLKEKGRPLPVRGRS